MKKGCSIAFILFLIIAIIFSIYGYWNYFDVYSEGNRDGVLVKFSKKGNIFKTYEGEIIQPGFRTQSTGLMNSNNFYFSVENDKVAKEIENASGKLVKVHYLQYRNVLPFRGDNYETKNQETGQYIVDKLISVQ